MKVLINSIIFLLISIFYENYVLSLSNYQIKELCQKKQKRSTCVKNLKLKKLNLLEGKSIEIPVIPFKK